jgi:hypothetical protein
MLADPAQRQQVLAAAAELGRVLVKAIRDKRTFPQQVPERKAFFDRMKSLVQFRKDTWRYEYEYWKSKGRL